MTTRAVPTQPGTSTAEVPKLYNGDRLTAAEFERRYEAMPDLKKAELIKGMVFMGSPVSNDHSDAHVMMAMWLGSYRYSTRGTRAGDNGTVRLGDEDQPQPDLFLRIAQECGGQAKLEGRYISGAPELVAEVSVTNVSYDLHDKLDIYLAHRVREYVVWRVEDGEIDWFVLRDGAFERLAPGADGVFRSEVFPGLWLNPAAMVADDGIAVIHTLNRGTASPEHAAFVAELARRAQGTP